MIALLPILATITGAILYVLPTNAQVCELGRITYGAGMIVTLYSLMGHTVAVLSTHAQ